jgi:hypothetical protein
MNNFNKYTTKIFRDKNDILRPWPIDKIEMDYQKWKENIRYLHIFILSNDCKKSPTHTKIGCTGDLKSMLLALNKNENKSGNKKKETGIWNLIFYLILPPGRNYHHDPLVEECRTGRGWHSRCEKAFKLVFNMGLEFRIHEKVLELGSNYFDASIAEYVTLYAAEKKIPIPKVYIRKSLLNVHPIGPKRRISKKMLKKKNHFL